MSDKRIPEWPSKKSFAPIQNENGWWNVTNLDSGEIKCRDISELMDAEAICISLEKSEKEWWL